MQTAAVDPGIPGLAPYAIETSWHRPAAASRRMLIVYAHPDDESFGNAGTILRYSAEGVAVHYACATRGETGSLVDPAYLEGHADMAALRTAELECAARELGLAAVHYLGYRDSGMVGSADNQHPAALVQAPLERVAGQVVALIRTLRPQVLITFAPYGGYGHPDHIHIHHATLQAFEQAGNPDCYPEHLSAGLEAWRPQKLYYATYPTSVLKLTLLVMRLRRQDPRRVGRNQDVDLVRAAAEATPITTTIACGAYLEQKQRVWRCHASQGGGRMRFSRLPTAVRRRLLGAEHFTRVVPAWQGAGPRERDLFTGL